MRTYKLFKLALATIMVSAVAVSLESTVADAADAAGPPAYRVPPPPPPYYNWSGFYVGAHAGVGWSDGGGSNSSGFVGGGQAGFNYQMNQWVWGLEGDISGTSIRDTASAAVVGPGAVLSSNATASLDWIATVTPRVGYAFDNWLVYGKVGGAWAHASGNVTAAINGVQMASVSVNSTNSGVVFGVGTEYALRGNWTAKLEYDIFDFSSGSSFSNSNFQVLKAGLNYRFGSPGWSF
ncbi:MAG TPA: outer membrane beta-barrel protein [Xanthobacteraceae bacterium]|jgi:outer membrane immunogenic protein